MNLVEWFEGHKAAKRFDEAWCVAHALVATDKATPAIVDYARTFGPRSRSESSLLGSWPRGPLPWRELQHPDEDVTYSLQLAKNWSTSAVPHAKSLAELGLKPKHRVNFEEEVPYSAILCRIVCTLLDVPVPAMFHLDKAGSVFERVTVIDGGEPYPALIVRKIDVSAVEQRSRTVLDEAQFICTKHLALTRLPYRSLGVVPNLQARWTAAVEATARRAALVLAGNLVLAMRLTPPEAHADLVSFWTSETHFQIRRDLGITTRD